METCYILEDFGWRIYKIFLVFSNNSIVELETNKPGIPPFKRILYDEDLLSNIFWNVLDTMIKENLGYSDKLNKNIYKNELQKIKDLLNLLDQNKIKYKINSVVSYDELKYVKIKSKGHVSISKDDMEFCLEFSNSKKRKYDVYISNKLIYEQVLKEIRNIILNSKLIIRN